MSSPTNQTGKPVKGNDFYDRDDFIQRLWERIEEGSNILLLAPRRVGKSSLMFRLVDEAESKGFQPLFVSVAGAQDEIWFLQELLNALRKSKASSIQKGKDKVNSWIDRIKKLGPVELNERTQAWREIGAELTSELGELEEKLLVLIDELPIFVLRLIKDSDEKRAGVFLDWFRELRIGPNAPDNVQWLLAGSIGLDTVAKQANLGDKINDLHLETNLGPFEDAIARQFLMDLANNYSFTWEDGALEALLAHIDWRIPYYLQLIFSEIRDVAREDKVIRSELVEEAYANLLEPAKRSRFDFWIQRLDRELPVPLNQKALTLLDTTARDPDGATKEILENALRKFAESRETRDDDLEFLLQVLQTDGYLVQHEKRFVFRSTLLKDFWTRTRLS